VLLMCIRLVRDIRGFEAWWRQYNALIRRLPECEQARIIAAKDKRKSELTRP